MKIFNHQSWTFWSRSSERLHALFLAFGAIVRNGLPPVNRTSIVPVLLSSLVSLAVEAKEADDLAMGRQNDAVAEVVASLMTKYSIPGISLGISIDGVDYFYNSGLANLSKGLAVSENTLFEVGSITKLFTTSMLALAVERGYLSFDSHPSSVLANFERQSIDRVTLLNLATYSAGGLPLQFPAGITSDLAATNWLAQWHLDSEPGAARKYSNPSIGLLGKIVAGAFGRPLSELIETDLFPKFGMSKSISHYSVDDGADRAWGYVGNDAVRYKPGPMAEETYGVLSTARDLLNFLKAQITPGTLKNPLQHAVEETHIPRLQAGPIEQCLGWERYTWPVSKEWLLGGNSTEMILGSVAVLAPPTVAEQSNSLYMKTGSTSGFGAVIAFIPSRRFGIVLLANKNYPIPARVDAMWKLMLSTLGEE